MDKNAANRVDRDGMSGNHFEQKPSARDNSMDLLRLLACLAVVLLHVNAQYFYARATAPSLDSAYVTESLINIITRFSVPAFVMISGTFVLAKEQNANAGQFWRKSFLKVFLPLLPAIAFFAIFDRLVRHTGFASAFAAIVTGTYYNLWYMYMLFCLYALVPVLVRLKAALPWRWWGRLGFALLAWAMVSQATSYYQLPYDAGVAVSFLGYFITGSFLYDNRHRPRLPSIPACISAAMALIAQPFWYVITALTTISSIRSEASSALRSR